MVLASFQLRLSPQKVKLNLSVGNVTDRMNLVQEKRANKVVLYPGSPPPRQSAERTWKWD